MKNIRKNNFGLTFGCLYCSAVLVAFVCTVIYVIYVTPACETLPIDICCVLYTHSVILLLVLYCINIYYKIDLHVNMDKGSNK